MLTGRAAALDEQTLRHIVQQVPRTTVHADLGAFAEHLLRRDRVADSGTGELS